MTPKELFGVAVRVIGLLFLLSLATPILWVFAVTLGGPGIFLCLLCVFAIGVVLLRGSPWIVNVAYPVGGGSSEPTLTPDLKKGRASLAELEDQGIKLPRYGRVLLAVDRQGSSWLLPRARYLNHLGYSIVADGETKEALEAASIPCRAARDLPPTFSSFQDAMGSQGIHLCFLIRQEDSALADAARENGIPCFRTAADSSVAIDALAALHSG